MARRTVTRKSKNRMRERSHERSSGSGTSSRPGIALPVPGARKPLDRGFFVCLFVVDRTGVLVAVAFLAGCGDGRRADFAYSTSVGWTVFLLLCAAHVRVLGAADAHSGSGQAMVAFA